MAGRPPSIGTYDLQYRVVERTLMRGHLRPMPDVSKLIPRPFIRSDMACTKSSVVTRPGKCRYGKEESRNCEQQPNMQRCGRTMGLRTSK